MMEKIGDGDAKLLLELEMARQKVLRTVHQAEEALYKFAQIHPEVYKEWFKKID